MMKGATKISITTIVDEDSQLPKAHLETTHPNSTVTAKPSIQPPLPRMDPSSRSGITITEYPERPFLLGPRDVPRCRSHCPACHGPSVQCRPVASMPLLQPPPPRWWQAVEYPTKRQKQRRAERDPCVADVFFPCYSCTTDDW